MIDKLKLTVAFSLVVVGVVAFYYFADMSVLVRALMVVAGVIAGLAIALTSTQGQAAWEFAKGARLEVRKVVWPERRETVQTTLVVLALVVVVGVYLWALDATVFWIIYDLVLGARNA